MVPRAGIEPALLSEPHFECGASTSSANGAQQGDGESLYHGEQPTCKTEDVAPFGFPSFPLVKEDLEAMHAVETVSHSTRSHSSSPTQYEIEEWCDAQFSIRSEMLHYADFAVRLVELVAETRIPDPMDLFVYYDTRGYFYAQIGDNSGVCNVTGQPMPWRGRKWLLSPHMTNSEIIQTFFKATMTAVEHETREQFLYKGVSVFDPHLNVERLVELREEKALDKRL